MFCVFVFFANLTIVYASAPRIRLTPRVLFGSARSATTTASSYAFHYVNINVTSQTYNKHHVQLCELGTAFDVWQRTKRIAGYYGGVKPRVDDDDLTLMQPQHDDNKDVGGGGNEKVEKADVHDDARSHGHAVRGDESGTFQVGSFTFRVSVQ